MRRRDFLQVLAAATASGLALHDRRVLANADGDAFYAIPSFGNCSLLHYTDSHAQLLPVWFREPDVNLGVGEGQGQPPHLVGEKFLRYFSITPGSREAYAFSCVDFANAARIYGRVGGYAELATAADGERGARGRCGGRGIAVA